MEVLDPPLNKIIEKTAYRYPDAEIYLFGSRARKDAKPTSDWDLLILIENAQLSFDQETVLMDTIYEIELDTGQVLSPFIYSKKDWKLRMKDSLFFKNVSLEGIRIK